MLKFSNFRRHGNKGRSGVNLCDTDKLQDIDNPFIAPTYLALCLILAELCLFCAKIFTFSLPWQPGSVWCKCQWHQQIAWPRKPCAWCNICGSISCISRVLAIFMLKFPNFRYHGKRVQSDVNFNNTCPVNCLTSKTPCLVEHLWLYFLY